jgi:hypothetical protein
MLRILFLRSRVFINPDNVYTSIIQSLFGNENIPEEAMEEMTEYLRMQHRLLIARFSRNLRYIFDNKSVIYFYYICQYSDNLEI